MCFIFLLWTLMTSANKSLEKKIFLRVENVIKQLVHKSAVLLPMPHTTLMHLSSSSNFLRASYLNECTLTYEPIVNFDLAFTNNNILLGLPINNKSVTVPCKNNELQCQLNLWHNWIENWPNSWNDHRQKQYECEKRIIKVILLTCGRAAHIFLWILALFLEGCYNVIIIVLYNTLTLEKKSYRLHIILFHMHNQKSY